MQNAMYKSFVWLLVLASLSACSSSGSDVQDQTRNQWNGEPFNGIYFWRTTFAVNDAERVFLQEHQIDRLYLRMFDVDVVKQNLWSNEEPLPVATLIFPDSAATAQTMSLLRDIVPVCFITLPALKMMQDREAEFAEKIVKRMLNMSSYHGFRNKVTEIQIDCDWTGQTEELYFALLNEIKSLLAAEKLLLSVTVRLHQLRTAAPPVDRGVLMVYNTGSIKNPHTQNSILSLGDAAQYLTHSAVEKYRLLLDYALPTFSWGVWFRGEQYMGILHCDDFDNPHHYAKIDSTHYRVLHPHVLEERSLQKGDMIRLEKSAYQTVLQVKSLLPFTTHAPARLQSVILYHLDANKLNAYENEEIDDLYRHDGSK